MVDFKTVKLGKVFEELRRKNLMTQEDLEFAAKLDRRTISNLENDQSKPSLETLVKIAHVFHMKPSALIQEFEEKTNLLEWMKQLESESEPE